MSESRQTVGSIPLKRNKIFDWVSNSLKWACFSVISLNNFIHQLLCGLQNSRKWILFPISFVSQKEHNRRFSEVSGILCLPISMCGWWFPNRSLVMLFCVEDFLSYVRRYLQSHSYNCIPCGLQKWGYSKQSCRVHSCISFYPPWNYM